MYCPAPSLPAPKPHRRESAWPVPAALAMLLVLALAAGVAGEALAHLSLIRQGVESGGVSEDGDQFGFAVATGDFNGDGYDDLATGAPDENVSFSIDAGSVVINWGSEYGLTQVGAVYFTATSIGGTSSPNAGGAAAPEAPIVHVAAGPNPSAGAVRVAYELKRAGRVGAQLFDLQGRRVRSFPSIELPAGAQILDWDGQDDGGRAVARGIYFMRLQFDGRTIATLKLVRID